MFQQALNMDLIRAPEIPHKKSEEHKMGQHTHATNGQSEGSEANQDYRTEGRRK